MGQHLSSPGDDEDNNNNNADVAAVSSVRPANNRGSRPSSRRWRKKHVTNSVQVTCNDLQRATHACLALIDRWFPERRARTYFMPPVHMNKVKYQRCTLGGGVTVQAVHATLESDWRDDEVMQRTLHCLRHLFSDSRKEPMVVLLQMQQDNYLNKRQYSGLTSGFPRPNSLDPGLRRGDFDLLFLHLKHGIIVTEIKSVGWRPGGEQDDVTVVKKVQQAVKQLGKAELVLQHLVSDLTPPPAIRKCLVLPNVSSQRLKSLLDSDASFRQEFLACLRVPSVPEAVSLCLCSDQMTSIENPAEVTKDILKRLQSWWKRLVTRQGVKGGNTAEIYDLLLARFCGPASTVEVYCVTSPRLELRTLGEAVSETGERMVQFALFPEQLALLESAEPRVYLTGPPGTGKTLILLLRAVLWARQGHVVHVASTGSYSEAATQLIYYQAMKTLENIDQKAAERIRVHLNGNKRDLGLLLTSLIQESKKGVSDQGGQLFVVADEADGMFTEFFTNLENNVADLHVWAASYHHQHRPPNMVEEKLMVSLRCPPSVMRRVETAVSFTNNSIYRFDRQLDPANIRPQATEGPAELHLSHLDHMERFAMNCEDCGLDIGRCLLEELGVGQKQRVASINSPPALEYRDVMIIPDWYQNVEDHPHDEERLPSGEVSSQASGIIRGLRKAGIPVKVVTSADSQGICDLARSTEDVVAVVGWGVVNGLERKVVVSVGEGREITPGNVSGVLHGASRCTAQLIYVRCPDT